MFSTLLYIVVVERCRKGLVAQADSCLGSYCVSADDLVLLANFEEDLRRVEEWFGAGGWVGVWRGWCRGVWSWSPDGARLIPEGALERCVVGVLMPALYGVLMREVGARARWWCWREAGDRGCEGFWVKDVCRGSQGFGQIGDRVCWDWMMDRNLGLLIGSAVLVICCAQEGAEKAFGAGVRSAWERFGRLAPVLTERERETCLLGAGLIPVFGECCRVVARL